MKSVFRRSRIDIGVSRAEDVSSERTGGKMSNSRSARTDSAMTPAVNSIHNPRYTLSLALSVEQERAVGQILGSWDFITLFRGGAGTGKSFAFKEVERGLVAAKRPVVVLVPQRQQVHDLERDGLPAQTLAQILMTKSFPRGAMVLVAEAGQVGGRHRRRLFRPARPLGLCARVG